MWSAEVLVKGGLYLEFSSGSLPGEWFSHFCMRSSFKVQIFLWGSCILTSSELWSFYDTKNVKAKKKEFDEKR